MPGLNMNPRDVGFLSTLATEDLGFGMESFLFIAALPWRFGELGVALLQSLTGSTFR